MGTKMFGEHGCDLGNLAVARRAMFPALQADPSHAFSQLHRHGRIYAFGVWQCVNRNEILWNIEY